MDIATPNDELLAFFKALADANRLKIVGLLANQEYSVEELAALLDLRPSTVSHHLARLAEAGLVAARAESYYNVYHLVVDRLEESAARLLRRETFSAQVEDVDLDAYDQKVLKNYLDWEGRLKALPTQLKKLEAVLRYVVRVFEPDQRYTEAQVNDLLSRYHEDTAQLRRELVEQGYMQRVDGGSAYWLPEN